MHVKCPAIGATRWRSILEIVALQQVYSTLRNGQRVKRGAAAKAVWEEKNTYMNFKARQHVTVDSENKYETQKEQRRAPLKNKNKCLDFEILDDPSLRGVITHQLTPSASTHANLYSFTLSISWRQPATHWTYWELCNRQKPTFTQTEACALAVSLGKPTKC